MPILHSSAVIMPGQFGPMVFIPFLTAYALALCMSRTGDPSVIITASSIPASAASKTASPTKAGGTNTILTVAPVATTASRTVSNTGCPKCSVPPLPGVTPPTIFVPYAKHCSA